MKLVIFDLDDTLFDRWGQLDETYKNLPNIKPFPDTLELLKSPGFKKVLVSFGNPEIQNKKLDVLQIRNYFDDVVVCSNNKDEKKDVFEKLSRKYKTKEIIIVGDRIDSELRYGKMLGFTTVRLVHGKYKDLKPKDEFEIPDYSITRLLEILPILKCKQ